MAGSKQGRFTSVHHYAKDPNYAFNYKELTSELHDRAVTEFQVKPSIEKIVEEASNQQELIKNLAREIKHDREPEW